MIFYTIKIIDRRVVDLYGKKRLTDSIYRGVGFSFDFSALN